ncbi:MAG: sulfotransferase family 2 domain-containing protein [Planctomycetota bacterium]|nr:sulfotransferase family 2 domain-containing protein [Planctomycetota bacterium]
MLVSHQHRFIFIHVPKTAGRSLRTGLKPYAQNVHDYWLNRWVHRCGGRCNVIAPTKHRWLRSHTTAKRARCYYPRQLYEQYWKFAFVRNPWDWLVSYYHFVTSHPNHRNHQKLSALGSFENYIRTIAVKPKFQQKDFVTDRQGKLIVNFIGRFETLQQSVSTINEQLGIQIDIGNKRNTSRHRDYRTYYDSELIRIVQERYRPDIEFFGYQFDGMQFDGIRQGTSLGENAPSQPGRAA